MRHVWETRESYTWFLVGRPEGERERPLARPRRRWDNIKIDLQKVEWRSMDCNHLAQDRAKWRALVNVIMNLWVPYNVGNLLSVCGRVSFSGRTGLHVVSYLAS